MLTSLLINSMICTQGHFFQGPTFFIGTPHKVLGGLHEKHVYALITTKREDQ
jgi:hypothetical protein